MLRGVVVHVEDRREIVFSPFVGCLCEVGEVGLPYTVGGKLWPSLAWLDEFLWLRLGTGTDEP
jgi:hypothetical protein